MTHAPDEICSPTSRRWCGGRSPTATSPTPSARRRACSPTSGWRRSTSSCSASGSKQFYGRRLPFGPFLTGLRNRGADDLELGELVAFLAAARRREP